MKRSFLWAALACLVLGGAARAESSLIGPWSRYLYQDLGFQIPVANGWKVTSVPQGIVFAMQYAPDPYVRVAVGRMTMNQAGLDQIIAYRMQEGGPVHLQKDGYFVDGHKAIDIEGTDSDGPYRDVFVEKDNYVYWIGFTAERPDLWPQYSNTFNIIIEGFHFI